VRILVISNFYPPYTIGGYELACFDVVRALEARGHQITVLTSKYKAENTSKEQDVYRLLDYRFETSQSRLMIWFLNSKSTFVLKRTIKKVKPELVFYWNPSFTALALIGCATQLKLPVCFYVSDNWLYQYFELSRNESFHNQSKIYFYEVIKGLSKSALRFFGATLIPIQYEQTKFLFASNYLKENALRLASQPVSSAVIYHGIDVNAFPPKELLTFKPYRLLYVGQLVEHKGAITAIEAIHILRTKYGLKEVTLDVVGWYSISDQYAKQIFSRVDELGLQNVITFHRQVSRVQMPAIYQSHDILLFTSTWEEPFSLTLLEAMASSVAIVATATGGSKEILNPGTNALVFEKNDPEDCAYQVFNLLSNFQLYESLCKNARNTVVNNFPFSKMENEIERSLISWLNNP
jgi:glycogen synthase